MDYPDYNITTKTRMSKGFYITGYFGKKCVYIYLGSLFKWMKDAVKNLREIHIETEFICVLVHEDLHAAIKRIRSNIPLMYEEKTIYKIEHEIMTDIRKERELI